MRRDHILFFLFLALLFIAPQLPLSGSLNLPRTSSLSFGFIGLIIWVLASPRLILNAKKMSWHLCMVFLIAFAFYTFLISAFSLNIISFLYAFQYLFYILFAILVLGSYIHKAYQFGELDKVFGVFIFIGMIFSIGGLVSVFTGPIYPHQTLATMRHWEGASIQQGVGFAQSQNGAGGILITFLSAAIFVYPRNWRHQWLFITIIGVALLATLSRSAILSFAVGSFALISIWVLRILATRWFNIGYSHKAARSVVYSLGILVTIVFALWFIYPSSQKVLSAVSSGFGVGGSETFYADIGTRFGLWYEGLKNWWHYGSFDMLFGVGFRNSMILVDQVLRTPHNFYIAVLGNSGVFGLALFASALGIAILDAICKILCKRNLYGIYPFLFLCLFGMSVHNMTGLFFYSTITVTVLVFCMVLLGVSKYMNTDTIEKRHCISTISV